MRVFSMFLWGLAWLLMPWFLTVVPSLAADAPKQTVWFDDVTRSVPPAVQDATSLTEYVRDCVLQLKKAKPAGEALPLSILADGFPRIVFVSVSDGMKPARVAVGSGKGMKAAADAAMAKLALDAEANQAFVPKWVKVDIVANVFDQIDADLTQNLEFDRSLFGMAFAKESGAAVLAEEIIANELADHHHAFSLERFVTYIKARVPSDVGDLATIKPKDVKMFRFSTRSLFADKHETVPLFRGHRMFDTLTKQGVLEAAKAAKDYLINSVNADGQFAFIYHADRDKLEPRYDIGHHYNNVFALLDTYDVIKDEQLLTTAAKTLAYGELSMGTWLRKGQRVHCVIDEKQNVYLRYNALATMAYAKYVQHRGDKARPEDRDRLKKLALAITVEQRSDGYITQHMTYPSGAVHDTETSIIFLPGEAMVALSEVNKVDPDSQWVEALEKIANNVIYIRDKDRSESRMIQDTWTVYGLGELYNLKKKRDYIEHALKITRSLRAKVNTDVRYEDWFGGCFKPPGTLPTATRSMTIGYAYELARDARYQIEAKKNLEAVIQTNAFLLQAQFRPEIAMYYKDPQRILGAFRESLTVPTIRTDYVQYALKSLQHVYRIMEADKVDSFDVVRPTRNAKP